LKCPYCSSKQTRKYGTNILKTGIKVQKSKCKDCQKRFNERTATPMSRLRHSSEQVALAMKIRREGNGIRATVIIFCNSYVTIIGWEKHLAEMEKDWSPDAPVHGDITVEGDELYTRIKKPSC